MKKEELLKEKDLLFKEILALRKELKSANDNILNAGKSIPFYKVVGPPLIISIILGIIITNVLSTDQNKNGFGIIFLIFIIGLFITTKISQKKIKENKEAYIKDRIAIQKQIVEKGKILAEIDNKLKSIEN